MDEGELYLSIEKVVWDRVYWACNKFYTLDKEEVFSDCVPIALRAIRKYKDGKSSLATFVRFCVHRYLLDRMKSPPWVRLHSKSANSGSLMLERIPDSRRKSYLEELSEEAKKVVNIICSLDHRPNRRNLNSMLRKQFKMEIKAIRSIYQEIKEALQ